MEQIRSANSPRYEDVGYRGVSEAIRHLRAGGGCLAITADRDIQRNGVPLTFFGTPAMLPLGAVEFAARTGAALMPAYCRREGHGFEIYFEDPLVLAGTGRPREDALVNAAALLARIESWLRADPGQWMVLERIWKPVQAGRGKRKKLALQED
jgi:KDO2-lipid IV(A) lauroyltransferase